MVRGDCWLWFWPWMRLGCWAGMLVGSIESSRAKINLPGNKEHLQSIMTFFKMNMVPNEVIEILPAFCRNCKLLSKWRFMLIIRYDDQLDPLPSTVGSNSDTHIILPGINNVEFVEQPLW